MKKLPLLFLVLSPSLSFAEDVQSWHFPVGPSYTLGYDYLDDTGKIYKCAEKVYHPGTDMNKGSGDTDLGTPISAVANGEVVSDYSDSSWGAIVIKHTFQKKVFYSLYGHLSSVSEEIETGVTVSGGQEIGKMGKKGAESAHLHFEIREDDHPYATNASKWCGGLSGKSRDDMEEEYDNPDSFIRSEGYINGKCVPISHSDGDSSVMCWFARKDEDIRTTACTAGIGHKMYTRYGNRWSSQYSFGSALDSHCARLMSGPVDIVRYLTDFAYALPGGDSGGGDNSGSSDTNLSISRFRLKAEGGSYSIETLVRSLDPGGSFNIEGQLELKNKSSSSAGDIDIDYRIDHGRNFDTSDTQLDQDRTSIGGNTTITKNMARIKVSVSTDGTLIHVHGKNGSVQESFNVANNQGQFYVFVDVENRDTGDDDISSSHSSDNEYGRVVINVTPPYTPPPYQQSTVFSWGSGGALNGKVCTKIAEPADPHTWNDNYLCANANYNLHWSSGGAPSNMRCTQIAEPAEPASHTWMDNYLCVPHDSQLVFWWSSAGPYDGVECVRFAEPADPHTWDDNFLCHDTVEVPSTPVPTPSTFAWSSGGAINGQFCTRISEAADPHTWTDNYFCSNKDFGIRWSSAGAIPNMRCTQIAEPAEPASHTWMDNYLCVPHDSLATFWWSSGGAYDGMSCTQWAEPADPHTWLDNYLCHEVAQPFVEPEPIVVPPTPEVIAPVAQEPASLPDEEPVTESPTESEEAYCPPESDTNGNGWGWDGEKGCEVVANDDSNDNSDDTTSGDLYCPPESDTNGNGWGWDGEKGCEIGNNDTGSNTNSGELYCPPESDTNGNGWGWDGEKGCKV